MTKTKTIDIGIFAYDFVEYEKNDTYATMLIHYGVLTYERTVSINMLEEEGIAFIVQDIVGVPVGTRLEIEEINNEHDIFDCRVWVGSATFEV